MSPSRYLPALLAITLLAMTACSEVRKLTYPGDITYIDRSQITGAMRQMADAVARLEKAIREAPSPDKVDQAAVVGDLKVLEALASSLHAKKGYTTDPVLDKHMSNFLDDVALAREQAEQHPPNYFLAGHIAGSCAACHRIR